MKLFKLTLILSAFVLFSTAAWAGNCPEYDAVGRDLYNFYSKYTVYYKVVNYKKYYLEKYSDFTDNYHVWRGKKVPSHGYLEGFWTNAGQLGHIKYYEEGYGYRYVDNPCFPGFRRKVAENDLESEELCYDGSCDGYKYYGPPVAVTDVWNEGTYEWYIVLQMKPESDINLNIYDCVLKHNETNLWYYAEQTGRYRMPWGELMWEGNGVSNPLVYAKAYPGEFATTQFHEWHMESGEGLYMDARTLPGLTRVPLDGVAYTTKAHWPEGIVMALPQTGSVNESGQNEWNLKGGDVIYVKIEIPGNSNSADVWYGPQSVILKYIGIINTEYFDLDEYDNNGTY